MDRLIRHRATNYLLLLILLGQFVGTAWSCPMEKESAPSTINLHVEHQAHMRASAEAADKITFYNASLSDSQESSDIALCCGDENACQTHHCNALNIAHLFETQAVLPSDKPQSLSYNNPIKRAPSALFRPPITPLSLA
jgi:hypothetical protein